MFLKPEDISAESHTAILLFSGGFDSTFAGILLRNAGIKVIALTFNYFRRPKSESQVCRKIGAMLKFERHLELDLPLGNVQAYSDIWPNPKYEGWFPHRNVIFFGLAAHFARVTSSNVIASGIRVWDGPTFNDATLEYFTQLGELLQMSGASLTSSHLDYFMPLIGSHHLAERTLIEDNEARLILESTWSCWRDGESPCGECNPCRDRKQFFDRIFGTV